jgi:hypothetical protein
VADLFTSGRIADVILGLVLLEAVALIVYWRRTRRGVAPADVIFNLGAGACLLMALRGALMQTGWHATAFWLAAALVAHLADLSRRWR